MHCETLLKYSDITEDYYEVVDSWRSIYLSDKTMVSGN
jgi:hypothetical protein